MRTLTLEWLAQNSAIYEDIIRLLVNQQPKTLYYLVADIKRTQSLDHELVYDAYKNKYNKTDIDNASEAEITAIIKEKLNIDDSTLRYWYEGHYQIGNLAVCFLINLITRLVPEHLGLHFFRETNYFVKEGTVYVSEHLYITHVNSKCGDIIYALNGSIRINAKVSKEKIGYDLVSIEIHSPFMEHEQLLADCFLKKTADIQPQGTVLKEQKIDKIWVFLELVKCEQVNIRLISRSAEDFTLVAYRGDHPENFIKVVDKIVNLTNYDYSAKQAILLKYIDLLQNAQEISDAFPYIVARFKPLFIPQAPYSLCLMNFFGKFIQDDFANFLDAVKAIWRKKLFADVDKRTDNTSKIALLCAASRTQICNFQRKYYFAVSETSTRKQIESKLTSLRDNPAKMNLVR